MKDHLLTESIIGSAIEVHKHLGPGLLESTYEECLCYELELKNIKVERQKYLPIKYKEFLLENAYRLDLLVEARIVIEIKCIDKFTNIHEAQILSYLKLNGGGVGLLINFNEKFLKDGLKRYQL